MPFENSDPYTSRNSVCIELRDGQHKKRRVLNAAKNDGKIATADFVMRFRPSVVLFFGQRFSSRVRVKQLSVKTSFYFTFFQISFPEACQNRIVFIYLHFERIARDVEIARTSRRVYRGSGSKNLNAHKKITKCTRFEFPDAILLVEIV